MGASSKYKKRKIGINLIPNRSVKDLAPYLCDKDFLYSSRNILRNVDYLVVNLSGLHASSLSHYFEEDNLQNLIISLKRLSSYEIGLEETSKEQSKINDLADQEKNYAKILIKIDPNLDQETLKKICDLSLNTKLDGIIIGEMYQKRKEKENLHIFEFFESENMKKIENEALKFLSQNTKSI